MAEEKEIPCPLNWNDVGVKLGGVRHKYCLQDAVDNVTLFLLFFVHSANVLEVNTILRNVYTFDMFVGRNPLRK